jgi:WD40 repeat protein
MNMKSNQFLGIHQVLYWLHAVGISLFGFGRVKDIFEFNEIITFQVQEDSEFECIAVLHGHSQDVKSVLWHPTKEILFSCGYDDTIKSWKDDEDDWYCQHTLNGHKSTVWDISFNRDGNLLGLYFSIIDQGYFFQHHAAKIPTLSYGI